MELVSTRAADWTPTEPCIMVAFLWCFRLGTGKDESSSDMFKREREPLGYASPDGPNLFSDDVRGVNVIGDALLQLARVTAHFVDYLEKAISSNRVVCTLE